MSHVGMVGRIAATRAPVLLRDDSFPVEWRVDERLVPYDEALSLMEARADAIRQGHAGELVWLLEHPPLYTAGTAAGLDLPQTSLPQSRLPLHRSGRGGQVTYHGPGQRIAYVMLDLQRRVPDVRAFVAGMERWIIETLAAFNIRGERRDHRVGVWVRRPDKMPGLDGTPAEDKIAAIGIRVRRWVTFHGLSLNVEPDLFHYAGITPCGISERHFGVTSFADLGRVVTMSEVDTALRAAFVPIFGSTSPA